MPPQHDDSPFGATMEGATTALPWAPGWNSVQALQRAPVPGLNAPEMFLFEDRGAGGIDIPLYTPPDDRRPGMEELSSLSPAIMAYQKSIVP
jgi:hypothetical protein